MDTLPAPLPSPPLPPALHITGLVKHFGAKVAVDHLDLSIPQGEFHALLGPNGAGKTTTLRIVAGLSQAEFGTVQVLGHDIATEPVAAKRVLAFLPDDPLLYGKLRPIEYLEFVAGPVDRATGGGPGRAPRSCCAGWTCGATRVNWSKDSRAACARSWRWPAR